MAPGICLSASRTAVLKEELPSLLRSKDWKLLNRWDSDPYSMRDQIHPLRYGAL